MKNMLLLFLVTITLTISGQSQGTAEKEDFPEPSISQEIILIRGDSFFMGKALNPNSNYVDNAKHKVSVSDFYLDKYEVTNASYYDFMQETGHRLPEFWGMNVFRSGLEYPDHPVVGVTWADASKYAEWEYAARGGLEQKTYPNGDDMDETLGNYNGTNGHPLVVGSFPANGFSLHDMAGNVVEWVQFPAEPEARLGRYRSGVSVCKRCGEIIKLFQI
ncbi:MAG TPA: hypothetical protein ENI20_02630 [Bacteroides sp.]|nr:hypothetical protein [Bacteroides sp.]